MKLKTFVAITIFILVAAGSFYFLRPYTFHGTVIQSPEPSYDFTLTGNTGEVSLSDYRGKLVLIYFGYTFCPDICPATLASIAQAFRDMGEDKAAEIQTIMISLDPERDTPEKLAGYVTHFYPTFIGITGSKEQLETVTSLYGIFFQKREGSLATDYLIDHTATLMVIDREGYLKLVFPFGVTPQEIADDLEYMLRQ